MAKAIEQTPILEGEDAKRFITILSQHPTKLSARENEIKQMIRNLPSNLKF